MQDQKKFELILVFRNGKLQGQRARVHSNRLIIGKSENSDLRLEDEGVSRQHALITYQQNKYWIEDLQSENGVALNKQRISSPTVLYHKDIIHLGTVHIGVLIPGTARPKRKLIYSAENLDLPTHLGEVSAQSVGLSLLKNKRVMIYGGAGLALLTLILWLNSGEQPPQGPSPEDSVEKSQQSSSPSDNVAGDDVAGGDLKGIQKEIEEKQRKLTEIMRKQADEERERVKGQVLELKSDDPTEDAKFQMSKGKFDSGMKELLSQNYVQAEQEFNLSLALNPKNLLVSEYLIRTRRKRRSVAQENYQVGKNYFASLQYDQALPHFRNVINLLEIERQNLDHESKGHVATLENAKSYLERTQRALESGVNR